MNNKKLEKQKEQLSMEIEELRQQIDLLVGREGLASPKVSALSKQFDDLTVKYLTLSSPTKYYM